jgi:hypothetical protein
MIPAEQSAEQVGARINAINWDRLEMALDQDGYAICRAMLTLEQCKNIAAAYDDARLFRSHILMERHGFGRGQYKYFTYPLPQTIENLRTRLYPQLAYLANIWQQRMGLEVRFPLSHAEFLQRCHAALQLRPTPLLLRYVAGDYNCLHQDLYGEHVFPLQAAFLLSCPQQDFEGGEFVLTEQRPRMQSRTEVVPLEQGDMVIFPVSQRPVSGVRGDYRVNMRHGVSRVRSGSRHVLGLIFHDAT